MIEIIGTPKLASKKTIERSVKNCMERFKINRNKIVEIVFVNQNKMRELNLAHRNIDKPTDVLSFAQNDIKSCSKQIMGSIIICEKIAYKLGENDIELVKHGFLHLLGRDHETDSNKWYESEKKLSK